MGHSNDQRRLCILRLIFTWAQDKKVIESLLSEPCCYLPGLQHIGTTQEANPVNKARFFQVARFHIGIESRLVESHQQTFSIFSYPKYAHLNYQALFDSPGLCLRLMGP